MRHITKFFIFMVSMATIASCASKPVCQWSDAKVQKWCKSNSFFKDFPAKPAQTTDLRQFAAQYLANQAEWDAALAFLKNNDFQTLELGRHDITANGTYANVQEYTTHYGGNFECHRAFIDIQYIASGNEMCAVAPLHTASEPLAEFDTEKDYQLFAKASDVVDLRLDKDCFAIFFPDDLHSPGMADGEPSLVKKVVVKIPVAQISCE